MSISVYPRLSWVLCTVLLTSSAQAAPTADEIQRKIARCAAVTSVTERGGCYDGLAKELGVSGPVVLPTATAGLGQWKVTRTKSPIDDSETIVLSLLSDNTITRRFGLSGYVALYVRCKEKRLDIYADWDEYLGIGTTSTRMRLDSDPVQTNTWSISTDHKSGFAPNARGFASALTTKSKLLLEVTPYGANPLMATWQIGGFAEASKLLAGNCAPAAGAGR
jgi:type VI secretion system protein VasI